MATPTKCEEKRLEGANPQTGYRARLLGKETYAYTAPGAMDNRDDHATERSGAKKEEGGALQENSNHAKIECAQGSSCIPEIAIPAHQNRVVARRATVSLLI